MTTTTVHREKSLGTISPADVPIGMLPTVELSIKHLQRIHALAQDRNESYQSIDGGEVFGANDSLTSHQVGLLGELAVALAYQTNLDTDTYRFGDDGSDLTLWGNTIDVKATATKKMTRPELLVRENQEPSADLYFLAHVISWGDSGARVRLHGYAPQEQVVARDPRRHPGEKLNYVVQSSELTLPPWTQNE